MRADIYLFTAGHVKSRQSAKAMIEAGNVLIDGKPVSKPSIDVNDEIAHCVEIINKPRFVSRGGEKLDYALDRFSIDVTDLNCIDIGASTGGFTDCLLQRGAAKIYAVDSGHSQLDQSIKENEKVISIEKYNAKYMEKEDFPIQFDLAVMDVSFISQTLIHSGIAKILKNDGIFVSLIKPQFECGRNALNSQGIVKKTSHHAQAIITVIDSASASGFSCIDVIRSPIEGGSGNVEFLAYFKKSNAPTNNVNENIIKNITKSK